MPPLSVIWIQYFLNLSKDDFKKCIASIYTQKNNNYAIQKYSGILCNKFKYFNCWSHKNQTSCEH